MNTVREQIIVEDPATESTQVRQTTQYVPTAHEENVAVAEKKNQLTWYAVNFINTFLVLRIVFLLLGAKDTGIAKFLYTITNPFVSLFQNIFSAPTFQGSYFDTAALLAIVVVSLIGWGISSLVDAMQKPNPVLN